MRECVNSCLPRDARGPGYCEHYILRGLFGRTAPLGAFLGRPLGALARTMSLSGASSSHSCPGTRSRAAFMGHRGPADPPSLLRGRNLHPQVTLSRSPAPPPHQAAHLAAPGTSHTRGSGLPSGCAPHPRLHSPRAHSRLSSLLCTPPPWLPLPVRPRGALGCFCVAALVTEAAVNAGGRSISDPPLRSSVGGGDAGPEVGLLDRTVTTINF